METLDLETRCFACKALKYHALGDGEETISGWICGHCIRRMDNTPTPCPLCGQERQPNPKARWI